MADAVEDAEFWLPGEFLTDDFFVEDKKARAGEVGLIASYPSEFSNGCGSNLSSPVESVTETESDEEEDYMAGLTRQMAHSFLQDDDCPEKEVIAGSPQSTLCAAASWSAPSRESSNGPSQVSSPPSTPGPQSEDDAWDLIYAVAGQVARMRFNEEDQQQQKLHGDRLLGPPRKPFAPVMTPTKKTSTGYLANPSLTQHELQVNQIQQPKQHQSPSAWGRQNKARACGDGLGNGRCGRTLGLAPAAWPPLQAHQQPQTGSGMRAVFLGGPGSRRESCGTGVFLPRKAGNPTDLRRKPACSTVLLPARVVQALNLNLDEIGAQGRYPGGVILDHDAIVARCNALHSQKKAALLTSQPAVAVSHEVRLPPEWTY